MEEIWKDIKGYEGYYQISNKANIRSLDRIITHKTGMKQKIKAQIMKKQIGRCGYERIILQKNAKARVKMVHRLMAVAFIKNPKNKPQINHIDGVKTNNNLDNLEWVTASENRKHAFSIGLMSNEGIRNASSKLTREEVFKIKWQLKYKNVSQKDLAEKFNICCPNITKIKKGRLWKHIYVF